MRLDKPQGHGLVRTVFGPEAVGRCGVFGDGTAVSHNVPGVAAVQDFGFGVWRGLSRRRRRVAKECGSKIL